MNDKKPPIQKVIYSELMPDCTRRYFVLLECGHFLVSDSYHKPKRRKCGKCADEFPYTIGALLKDYKRISLVLSGIRHHAKKLDTMQDEERTVLWRLFRNW